MAYDHFKTLYKAFQCSKRDMRLRNDQVTYYAADCKARFGLPSHILYGSSDLEALLTSVFPDAELVFDAQYADQFWIGYPDEDKYLISGDTLNVLLDDADALDKIDPNDSLGRRKARKPKTQPKKVGLAALPGYDDLAKEVAEVIAATPESGHYDGYDSADDVPF